MCATSASAGLQDTWARGGAYERYVGRWSRLVAPEFLDWLHIPSGKSWLDVGCGTGAVSEVILQRSSPSRIEGVDSSQNYVGHARESIRDPRVDFNVGDACQLEYPHGAFDAAVSALALNFIPQPDRAVGEMARVVAAGGTVAAYVWDYAGRAQFLRHFWNAAAALDLRAKELDEGHRFPLCQPAALEDLFGRCGLQGVEVRSIDVSTDFKDFDDFWSPFLGGQGPAPSYVLSLSESARDALRDRIRLGLPYALDGSIPLVARAWAVRGRKA